jgi:rhodanese-related sulfurtransferase
MSFLSKLFGPPVPSLDAAAAQAKLNEKPRPLVLDVREPSEYAAGHIAGSTLIPAHQLSSRMGELPKDREIICVCASGSRSSSAARQLASNGYNVLNLSGGMSRWLRAGLPVKKGMGK